MIVVRLRGGLGNQMFQFAMAKRIAIKLNTSLKIDLTALLKVKKDKSVTNRPYQLHIFQFQEEFLIKPQTIKALYKYRLGFLLEFVKGLKLLLFKKVKEQNFLVDQDLYKNPINNAIYSGYWQSEKYFNDFAEVIRKDFRFQDELSTEAKEFYDKIKKTNSVCVHIRRGDYVTDEYFEPMSLEYFKLASDYIKERTEEPHFYIFSDEPNWCKDYVKLDYEYTIVDFNTNKIRYKEDLELMSCCDHFIMSASSFSWWAQWLSNKQGKITIAPKQWFLNEEIDVSDLVSENWIRM